jgi:hypothetical protein
VSDLLTTLERLLERRRSLDVTADLTATVGGGTVHIESYTDRVFVDLPSVGAARRLYGRHGDRFERLPPLLAAADLTLEIQVDGRTVAVVGPPERGGRVERALGYPGVSLRPTGVVRALLGG